MSYEITKYSPIENKLNAILRRIIESGLQDYFGRQSIFLIEMTIAIKAHAAGVVDGEYSTTHGITMEHMGRLCQMFAFVMFGSVGVFAVEIIYFYKLKIYLLNIRLLRVRLL